MNRLPEQARDKVLQFDLGDKGILDYGKLPFYGHSVGSLPWLEQRPTGIELFINDEAMTLSRWPNTGYTKIEEVVDIGEIPRWWQDDIIGRPEYVPPEQRNPDHGFTLKLDSDRLHRWTEAEDMWMFGHWFHDWSDQTVEVKSIDPTALTITSKQPSGYGIKKDQRFYVYNLMEEIDMPGEWYLDRANGILYFYPPSESLADNKIQLSIVSDTLIQLNDVSYVTLQGLNMEATRGSAIEVNGGSNNLITQASIRNTGAVAVVIDGHNNGITSSYIANVNGGIELGGGDKKTLTPGENYAEDNHIHNFSRIKKTYNPAVNLSGVGQRVAHNEMHDAPHNAIMFNGNDHLIEYNEIYSVNQESDDMSAIYAGRNTTNRGHVIRYNYIHDLHSSSTAYEGTMGIYLDDLQSGTVITGNVFANMKTGIFVNGGRDNIINNNIFAETPRSVSISDWGLRFLDNWALHGYGTYRDPITMELVDFDHTQPPYSKYPHLSNILEDEAYLPKYNEVTNNLFYKSSDFHFRDRGVGTTMADMKSWNTISDNHVTTTDPGFVDVNRDNYSLKDDAVLYERMPLFEAIPFDQIGTHTMFVPDTAGGEPSLNTLFEDDFENGLLNWDVVFQNPQISNEQQHDGLSSVKFDGDTMHLIKNFTSEQQGIVRMWMYDDAANSSSVVMAIADAIESTRMIGVHTAVSGSHYVYRVGGETVKSGVARSTGWHEIKFDYTSGTGVDMYIDDQLIASPIGVNSFLRVALADYWGDKRISNAYFDTVSVVGTESVHLEEHPERESVQTGLVYGIELAQQLLDQAEIGSSPGQYEEAVIGAFESELGAALAVKANANAKQAEIDQATFRLQTALRTFEQSKIISPAEETKLSMDSASVIAGDTFTVPVTLDAVEELGRLKARIHYDADLLEMNEIVFTDVFTLEAHHTSVPGQIMFDGVNEAGVTSAKQIIATIQFTAKADIAQTEMVTIHFSHIEANKRTEEIYVIAAEESVITIEQSFEPGDINRDGQIDGIDAMKLLRHLIHIESLTLAQARAADYDGDGELTVSDALKMLQKSVGLLNDPINDDEEATM